RADLFVFLSQLGKPGPFDAAKSQAVRLWQIAAVGAADAEKARRGDASLGGWAALPATVGGSLLGPEVRALVKEPAGKGVYAVTRFEATKAGAATLTFSAAPAAVWLDGRPVAVEKVLRVDVARGPHTLAIRLDMAALPEQL